LESGELNAPDAFLQWCAINRQDRSWTWPCQSCDRQFYACRTGRLRQFAFLRLVGPACRPWRGISGLCSDPDFSDYRRGRNCTWFSRLWPWATWRFWQCLAGSKWHFAVGRSDGRIPWASLVFNVRSCRRRL